MPRYTHLVVSSEESSDLKLAQQLHKAIPGVTTEAHCGSASEAELTLLYGRTPDSGLVYGVIELAKPIEY